MKPQSYRIDRAKRRDLIENALRFHLATVFFQDLSDGWFGDRERGSYWFADGQGNEIAMEWDRDGMVVLAWDHEQGGDGPENEEEPSSFEAFASLIPKPFHILAERAHEKLSEGFRSSHLWADGNQCFSSYPAEKAGKKGLDLLDCFALRPSEQIFTRQQTPYLQYYFDIRDGDYDELVHTVENLAKRAFNAKPYRMIADEKEFLFRRLQEFGAEKDERTIDRIIRDLAELKIDVELEKADGGPREETPEPKVPTGKIPENLDNCKVWALEGYRCERRDKGQFRFMKTRGESPLYLVAFAGTHVLMIQHDGEERLIEGVVAEGKELKTEFTVPELDHRDYKGEVTLSDGSKVKIDIRWVDSHPLNEDDDRESDVIKKLRSLCPGISFAF